MHASMSHKAICMSVCLHECICVHMHVCPLFVRMCVSSLQTLCILKGQCINVKAVQVLVNIIHNHCDALTHVQHIDLAPLKKHGVLFSAKKPFSCKIVMVMNVYQ